MKRFGKLSVCILILGSCISLGCGAHTQTLIVKNFISSGSPCWDAMVVNQAAMGCTSVTIEERYAYKLYYCQTYSEGSDPTEPWLVNNFYIVEVVNASVEPTFDQPVFPICVDSTMMILYGEKAPFEPEGGDTGHPRLD